MMVNNTTKTKIIQLVSFKLGEEEFGVNILIVKEINRVPIITKVPNAPDFIEGIMNLRGRVVPVVDLRTKLNLEKRNVDKSTRVIVVELKQKTIGFIVDEVSEVLRIPSNILENPPSTVRGIQADYISAIGKLEHNLLILLDLEKIFSVTEEGMLDNLE